MFSLNSSNRLCGVLIDTGAVHSNYINKDFVETLNENEAYETNMSKLKKYKKKLNVLVF